MSKKCRLIFIGKLDFQSIFNKHVQAQRLQPGLGALRITQSNPTANILLTSLKKNMAYNTSRLIGIFVFRRSSEINNTT